MKLYSQPTERVGNHHNKGFTLIEMIGVLAVIAILAAVLIPKVFEAISSARINNAAMSCQTMKTALVDHYAKYGNLAYDGSTSQPLTPPQYYYDTFLLKEQLVDKLFDTKVGDPRDPTQAATGTAPATISTRIDLLPAVAATTAVDPTKENGAFCLDGAAAGPNEATGTYVAVAVISGVAINDAWELSKRIDGANLSQPDIVAADKRGRVIYDVPGTGGTTTVYVYLTHR
jgi:prepilin-type N-terminal cleavage/methylation domain-containing protein